MDIQKILAIGLVSVLVASGFATAIGSRNIRDNNLFSNVETLYVGGTGSGNYSTIQNAIDNASDGYRVVVYNGSYNECLSINKTITLQGESKHDTIINGTPTDKVIEINTDWTNITGFSIENGSYGVYIRGNKTNISNNIVQNCEGKDGSYTTGKDGAGIYLELGSDNIIENNRVENVVGGDGA